MPVVAQSFERAWHFPAEGSRIHVRCSTTVLARPHAKQLTKKGLPMYGSYGASENLNLKAKTKTVSFLSLGSRIHLGHRGQSQPGTERRSWVLAESASVFSPVGEEAMFSLMGH